MKFGGVSLKGNHTVNQDSFSVREVNGGYVVAVSDGLGSRPLSQAGSAILCQTACQVAEEFACNIEDDETFLATVYTRWIQALTENDLAVEKCNATALIAVVGAENIWAYRLGDGFISIATDDEVTALLDAKEDDFVNATECLRSNFQFDKWECRCLKRKNFLGLVAATDGITFHIDEKTLGGFISDFCANYAVLELGDILTDLKAWLPTLIGGDDKTLAFLLKEAKELGN